MFISYYNISSYSPSILTTHIPFIPTSMCTVIPINFNFIIRLCEAASPYNYIARIAIHDMLNAASDKILPVIPKLIIPIKNALNTKNCDIIMATLRIIQHMCNCGKFLNFLPTLFDLLA